MGCVYSDADGKCELYDGNIDMPVDKEGYCQVEDDPDPSMSCEDYEERQCGVMPCHSQRGDVTGDNMEQVYEIMLVDGVGNVAEGTAFRGTKEEIKLWLKNHS